VMAGNRATCLAGGPYLPDRSPVSEHAHPKADTSLTGDSMG
jgi:hypothetical protein